MEKTPKNLKRKCLIAAGITAGLALEAYATYLGYYKGGIHYLAGNYEKAFNYWLVGNIPAGAGKALLGFCGCTAFGVSLASISSFYKKLKSKVSAPERAEKEKVQINGLEQKLDQNLRNTLIKPFNQKAEDLA